jgi:hypothetical protein
MGIERDLWDEAEQRLRAQGLVYPPRRHHSHRGNNGCTHGPAEDCPACTDNARARAEYQEALFTEIGNLRRQHEDPPASGD